MRAGRTASSGRPSTMAVSITSVAVNLSGRRRKASRRRTSSSEGLRAIASVAFRGIASSPLLTVVLSDLHRGMTCLSFSNGWNVMPFSEYVLQPMPVSALNQIETCIYRDLYLSSEYWSPRAIPFGCPRAAISGVQSSWTMTTTSFLTRGSISGASAATVSANAR